MRSFIAVNARTPNYTIAHVQLASTSVQRIVGLLQHTSLAKEEGIWITPSNGIHTFGMKFAIDVVGLDAGHRVIRLWKNLLPWRMTTLHYSVRSVLEIASGRIHQCDIQIGDSIQMMETKHSL